MYINLHRCMHIYKFIRTYIYIYHYIYICHYIYIYYISYTRIITANPDLTPLFNWSCSFGWRHQCGFTWCVCPKMMSVSYSRLPCGGPSVPIHSKHSEARLVQLRDSATRFLGVACTQGAGLSETARQGFGPKMIQASTDVDVKSKPMQIQGARLRDIPAHLGIRSL